MSANSKRVVLATIGSLGDLHPCLDLALALRARGHDPVIASTRVYRAKVEALGLEFHPMRPEFDADDPALIHSLMDMRRGPEFLLRKLILPALRETFDDLCSAVRGADLMIAGEIVFAAPLVAEQLSMPWVSAILSPFSFYSAYDPPVSPVAPELTWLRGAGWRVNRALLELGRLAVRRWTTPVGKLRRELGLNTGRDPLFFDKFSRDLTLALFSPELARPQPDWPPRTVQTGFVYSDGGEKGGGGAGLPPALTDFLDAGEAPVVFTLGSTAVHDPRGFFEQSAGAARMLGRRAVFLNGESLPPAELSADHIALPYAPFSEVFPRAAAIVHQGGVGTTAQALRSGRPTLIMPCGFDQPDNAARVRRLGTGLTLSRGRYSALTAARALQRLMSDPTYAETSHRIGAKLQSENGLEAACNEIERLLNRD